MKKNVSSLLSGILFAVGLGISGMTKPSKIVNFLSITDWETRWDPSLLFVMGGAVITSLVLFRIILKQPTPLFSKSFALPGRKDLDARLIVGSVLFGIGWGIGGYCPGPALVSLVTGSNSVSLFLASMILGIFLNRRPPSLEENTKDIVCGA